MTTTTQTTTTTTPLTLRVYDQARRTRPRRVSRDLTARALRVAQATGEALLIASCDYGTPVEYPAATDPDEAAAEYVADSDWGKRSGTDWAVISVWPAWRCAGVLVEDRDASTRHRIARHDPTKGDLCPCGVCRADCIASLEHGRAVSAEQDAARHPRSRRRADVARKARARATEARQLLAAAELDSLLRAN
jgi:hypothetical protein